MTALAPGISAPPDAVRFLDRPGGRIAYDDRGNGPLVVMVPGLGDLKEEYRFLAPALAEAGLRAAAMDLRGHGRSSTGWADYGCAAIGSDILALIEHLGGGPAVVVGTSMGAGAAAWAAAERPDLIARLVLIGAFVRDVPPKNRLAGIVQELTIRIAFADPWAAAAWSAYYARLYPSVRPADLDAYRARLAASLREPGRFAAMKAMFRASKAEVEARLHEIAAPTLVIMGTRDADFADPAAEGAFVAGRTGGTLVMIEGAGHYPHAEMPDAVVPAIRDFLARSAG